MATTSPLPTWIKPFLRLHAVLLLLFAAGLYLVPEKVFGEVVTDAMARFTCGLLASALVALAVVLVASSDGRRSEMLQVGLIGALVFDVQVPLLLIWHPATLVAFRETFGIVWMVVPIGVIGGLTVPAVMALLEARRVDEIAGSDPTG
jgi:hypothetical protein